MGARFLLDANICIYTGQKKVLVTNNEKEFRRIGGLRVENWAAGK